MQLSVQYSVEAYFVYILLLSSVSKHYLIPIGKYKVAQRAFQVSQGDSSFDSKLHYPFQDGEGCILRGSAMWKKKTGRRGEKI